MSDNSRKLPGDMQIDDDLAHAAFLHIHPRPGVTFEADEYDEATLARASDAAQAALNAAALQQLSLPEQSLPSAMHLQSVMKHYAARRLADEVGGGAPRRRRRQHAARARALHEV